MFTRYAILPEGQRALLPLLKPMASLGHVLYGGTSIALRLGHRQSVDFDFFSAAPLDRDSLMKIAPFLAGAEIIQDEPDALSVQSFPSGAQERPVKLSFFGGLGFGRVGEPSFTDGGELLLASLDDLFGHKLKVLLQRVELKDYQDIAALLRAGLPLGRGLGAACALFPQQVPPAEALRALVYFQGGELARLSAADRRTLIEATASVGEIEPMQIVSRELSIDADG